MSYTIHVYTSVLKRNGINYEFHNYYCGNMPTEIHSSLENCFFQKTLCLGGFNLLAILCPTLVPPTNGMISYDMDMTTPFDYQTMATYSCASGYTLTGGDNVRTCVGSSDSRGEWSGMSPICEGMCVS